MDSRSCITPWNLECMLRIGTTEPKALPLSLLKEITGDFSNELEIGSGGFAVVYKGMLVTKIVAVKRMSNTYMHEKEFHREVECLMMVKHKNVIRFLGYCADTQGSMERYNGKYVMADVQQRLLCFEYLPNGSLHDYITDESSGLTWRERFHIIKGICQGLYYLHQKHIVHLDLKPANILLGDNLVAKIADFGLSRCFDEMQTRAITQNTFGTFGYLAPEFGNGEISYKLDIYSLGVIIIEILTGKKGYHDVDKVVKSWSNKLEISQLEQVRVCAEIGMECTRFNPAERPDTQHIISKLHETESVDGYIQTGMITSQQEEDAPNELHQDTPIAPGEISSKEEDAPNELHQDTPIAPGEISSKSAKAAVHAIESSSMLRMHIVNMVMDTLLPMLNDLQKNTRDEIIFVKNELESIEAALIRVSGTPKSREKYVKLSALEIKGLSYEIVDCVERYLVHLECLQQEKSLRSIFIPVTVKKDEIQHKLDSDIKGIKERVIEVSRRVQRYMFAP